MSILIKGMEMPKNCTECRFSVDGWCYVLRPESEEERKRIKTNYCPLIELPPHGRLIDASEEIIVQTYDDQYEEWKLTKMTIDDLLCVGWVEADAPTIIEAEGVSGW